MYPDDWPCFDLSVPDGTPVDLVMTATVDDLKATGGP